MMVKIGKWIAKHKNVILVLGLLLIIPSIIGMNMTRINYDVLSYLPGSLETVKGQDTLVDEFGMGAFSMVIVEGMDEKDVVALKEEMKSVDHVADVIWYDDLMDISVPMEMIPSKYEKVFKNGDSTMLVALFDNTTSSDETMDAVTQLRKISAKHCFVSGMSGVVTDIKSLALSEMPIYVLIAVILCLIILSLTMDSWITPFIFMLSIGIAILYNMGTNMFLSDVSYITKALAAVLQLGVTLDYSIFLLNSYEENKKRFPGERNRAMAHAISNTFKSVVGSSVTTIAGFVALCFMTFKLGTNIGIVMAKGVAIGVVCCVTLLPALVLTFDKWIDRTTHKPILPDLGRLSAFITRHNKVWLAAFLILLIPAIYGNAHTDVYYNIDKGLPDTLKSSVANKKLDEDFHMNNVYMVMLKNDEMDQKEKAKMMEQIEAVDGVKWAIGMESVIGPSVPEDFIPPAVKSKLQSDNYEIQFICSDYKTATDEVNEQVKSIDKIVKSYNKESMVIGEAPLTKDLTVIADSDMRNVNVISVIAIFIIICIVFKSLSLPVILVAIIEFAICVNMAVPFYTGTELPFVASIVIGTVQLGSTVDYAILMTSRYQRERSRGRSKKEAISLAHQSSMKSILISGVSFFAATFGVGLYSKIDMISSLCTLLSRGAIISTVVVICVLPAMFMVFDKLICKTSKGFLPEEAE